jgi:hypothetical protein
MNEEIEMLRRENERLLSYIRACRARFGDAAVNSAIMEMCPPEPVRRPMTEEKARQLFEDVRRLHSPESALANVTSEPRPYMARAVRKHRP